MTERRHISIAHYVDESGKTYGQLSVIRYVYSKGEGRRKSAIFECVCTCGEIILVKGQQLRNGHKTMCAACRNLVKGNKP